LTEEIANMNSAPVFIVLLLFGWLWGFWGLLFFGVPIVVVVRAMSRHVARPQLETRSIFRKARA
jgi:predicted PurR-regulated permease PerM